MTKAYKKCLEGLNYKDDFGSNGKDDFGSKSSYFYHMKEIHGKKINEIPNLDSIKKKF